MFTKILIANRAEIAVRVIRTAKALGYETVAVFSEADANAPHVHAADEAVCIGKAAVNESYLNSQQIIHAARLSGADAIHPGYGFLSENAGFAKACTEAGITFIGPNADAIELMGSKRLSKLAMLEANVPCIPGYEGADQTDATLIAEAKRIGFPVMIKASAGGGGRGMRLVNDEQSLAEHIRSARSEAESAFGSGELILEKAVIQPRHIEIQVFADQHGNVIYLGERDCSIQRRHQKVVEEAPSPFVDDELRQRMGQAAVQAAKACAYVGAGTVEFLVDEHRNFYFLEMNTRLQVEHPVTELITGTDLVAWQIKVAAGEPLPLNQDQVQLQGHAIEVRLYAEDPAQGFLPQTGKILHWQAACSDGIRIDGGIQTGQNITPFYDPMLAKVIAYGDNREEARRRLKRALKECVLFGVRTNRQMLSHILNHPAFITGEATTAFINESFADDTSLQKSRPSTLQLLLTSSLIHRQQRHPACSQLFASTYRPSLQGWQNSIHTPWPYEFQVDDQTIEFTLTEQGQQQYTISMDELPQSETLVIVEQKDGLIYFEYQNIRQRGHYFLSHDSDGLMSVYLQLADSECCLTDITYRPPVSQASEGSGTLLASMDGAIVAVDTHVGQTVSKGQTLVVLEAMKMEHPLKADMDGVITEVLVTAGQQVKGKQRLIQIENDAPNAHSSI